MDTQDLPLAGIKIIEFCSVAAGPFCGMLLADMGAEVIKVEPPDGDTLRQWPPLNNGYSENFASLNRNKMSVQLNLKNSDDLRLARQMILSSDVVIENNRPGVMKRLGLSYETFSEEKPALIYCSISAYGQSGPRSTEGGFDLTMQAAAGVMSVTGEENGAPAKCGVPISDFSSGLYAAFAIASTLASVRAGGTGKHIDVPMFGCTLGVAALQTSEYFGTGLNPRRLGSAHPRNAPYQAFSAKDGYFAIAAGNQKLWSAVCEVVQIPELEQDPRFATTSLRAQNQIALKEMLERSFNLQSVDHWINAFKEAGVPHAHINDYASALNDPQVAHMNWVRAVNLPDGTEIKTFASPLMLSGEGLPIRINPPALGAHTNLIRSQFSTTKGDIEQ
ncbi:carnitine dehydratase [Advenella sp. S44]|nr:carnitine dehydratase [Advenella sp. S44]